MKLLLAVFGFCCSNDVLVIQREKNMAFLRASLCEALMKIELCEWFNKRRVLGIQNVVTFQAPAQ